MKSEAKQISLKTQDFVVALKIAVNSHQDYLLATLSHELQMVISAVHASVVRCERARLISRASGSIRPMKSAIKEFAIHGARYAFPASHGAPARGMATTLAGPSLRQYFDQTKAMPQVWPDPEGSEFGPSLTPIAPIVPTACKTDPGLYDVLTLIDAIRAGAARERELASTLLEERLT